jgi:uncharacterized cupin superfamily protein
MTYVAHWDDVRERRIDKGPVHAVWQDLGRAAGAVDASVKRERIDPGAWPTPVHAHGRDEEFFYVLSGSGLSWQDGRTHEVAPGDFIFHPAPGPAHTLIAGDEGLEVLVFGPEAPTALTHLPRAGVFWAGPWWALAPGGAHPFEREPEQLPGEPGERPPTTVRAEDAPEDVREHEDHHIHMRDVGEAVGSRTSGINEVTIPAGKRGWPRHCHSAEHEIFVVLEGSGVAVLGDEQHPIRRGHVVCCPPATRIAHTIHASAGEPIRYLAWGTRDNSDMCFYPDSGKISLRGLGVRGRIEPMGYWEGEP